MNGDDKTATRRSSLLPPSLLPVSYVMGRPDLDLFVFFASFHAAGRTYVPIRWPFKFLRARVSTNLQVTRIM